MRRVLALLVLAACDRPGPAASAVSSSPAEPAVDGAADPAVTRFVRAIPPWYARRSVDACAYVDADAVDGAAACIDALGLEPDPARVRYMLRLSEAWVGAVRPSLSLEVAECCSRAGPCGAPKKTGHADCPKMDDGFACLVAAELRASAGQDTSVFHERACACDPERARIPVPGGRLACDGSTPVTRAPMPDREAREARACAVCDPEAGPASCAAEIARLRTALPDVARYLERVHIVRCQLP